MLTYVWGVGYVIGWVGVRLHVFGRTEEKGIVGYDQNRQEVNFTLTVKINPWYVPLDILPNKEQRIETSKHETKNANQSKI